MSATPRTTDQEFVDCIAMNIFRECRFTLTGLQDHVSIDEAVAKQLADYANKSMRTITRIACAFPDMAVRIDGSSRLRCRTWQQRLARGVITRRVKDIVGLGPRFRSEDDDYWVFLGGDLRDLEALPWTDVQVNLYMPDDDFVDYWGSQDGAEVVVRYGCGRFDYVPGHLLDTHRHDMHVTEAFRRLALHREATDA